MALPIFRFVLSIPGGDRFSREALVSRAADGKVYTKAVHRSKVFSAEGVVQFPNVENDLTYEDLDEFMDSVDGPVLHFLVKGTIVHNRKVRGYEAGTAVGGAGQQFAFPHRYIDEATLIVRVDGSVVTQYTIEGNILEAGAEPYIQTTSGFPAGEVTFEYERYYRVRFTNPSWETEIQVPSLDLDYPGTHSVAVAFEEVDPGDHLVNP